MKNIITTACLLFMAFFAQAQTAPDGGAKKMKKERTPPGFTHELGIETNKLIARLVSDSVEDGLPDKPYFLTYKIGMGKWALRTGIGGDRSKTVEREDGFADSHTEKSGRFDVRAGLERRFPLGKKWEGNVALDGIGFFSQNKTIDDSGFDVITLSNTVNGWGLGPSFGLQFNLTERLSFYTEGFFYYTSADRQGGRTFKNFPEFDDKLKTIKEEDIKVSLPAVLYIVFRF